MKMGSILQQNDIFCDIRWERAINTLAARGSLQYPTQDQTLARTNFYQLAKGNFNENPFCYRTANDHAMNKKALECKLDRANTVPGTVSTHAFLPGSKRKRQSTYFLSLR